MNLFSVELKFKSLNKKLLTTRDSGYTLIDFPLVKTNQLPKVENHLQESLELSQVLQLKN